MPEPAACKALRKRARDLATELQQVLGDLLTEPFGDRRAQLQERAELLELRIDDVRAQMEAAGCDAPLPHEPPPTPVPTLEEFGHGSMRVGGRKALGPRPLVVVLMEWDDDGQNGFLNLLSEHPLEYYEKLAFGHPTPPFTTTPVNPASLTEYVQECSNGRFWFTRAGVLGPVPMGAFGNPDELTHVQKVAERIAGRFPYVLFGMDVDASSVVTADELVVLVVENHRYRWPANRSTQSVPFTVRVFPVSVTKTMELSLAFAGALTPFYQIGHEVTHSLGTRDMYNPGNMNHLLTLMGAYPFFSNDQVTVHLDAWHKLALGWCEPERVQLTAHGSALVLEISAERPDGAVILWHPSHGASEYFLLERRSPTGGRKYDADFPGDGVLIWHVDPSRAPMHRGSPDLALGGNGVWRTGTETPQLTWTDGSVAADSLTIKAGPVPESVLVSW
ncbi:hypothetical protein BN159_1150 [Streptomyces davaonensis JCM 4913]|uniref:Uncharacterized protein n=1 Tax=Streptomyces davaonensis (strain DSM 101723 / JCM 4913 / KCC S-0913 / 768) TaxID=1214101 RepID=K4QYS5_STRDJ|nr:hypothetical protein [Streptomyces davaonensis]CCK25529.1 hypothetical protein BN159_1150 [Streptomyces davaonensis JCM 4913]